MILISQVSTLQVDAFDAAIKSADEVLRIQSENVKALFRKGKVNEFLPMTTAY
jgi:hypothetical protein